MKKILSTVLALVMVCTCLPFPALAIGKTQAKSSKLIGKDAGVALDNTKYLANSSTENFTSLSNVGKKMSASDIEMKYTADELRAMSREELIENTKHTGKSVFEEVADRSNNYGELKDPRTSDDAKIQQIMANKDASNAKMQESIKNSEKAAKGETKGIHDDKYYVVDNTILITNEDELRGLHNQTGYFRLACDIKITSAWEPIDFNGTLEGAGYTISGATMQFQEYDYIGFFSELGENAVVQNINFDFPYVYANANAGAICAYNQGAIINCHVVGGVVATYLWADFEYPFWEISGYNVGGICGVNEGLIMQCSYMGDVDGWAQCGGICGVNAGYIFGCYMNGNVAYETNNWDIDEYGYEYTYYNYGQAYAFPFSTMLRDMWACYMLLYYGYVAYGFNGGLVGENYFAVLDCNVQGAGVGSNYNVGVVGGFDCMGGIAGGDAGVVSHCYSIDRAFPVPANGAEIYCAWDYGDAGEGIYYMYEYFTVHKGIAYNCGETTAAEEVYFYGNQGLPCEDGAYHGTALTAEQFYNPSTFATWNHGEWNAAEIWIIEPNSIPTIAEAVIAPEEYVIRYEVANAGGLLDGDVVAFRLAHHDANYNYTEPDIPVISATIDGYGVTGWYPATPAAGKPIYGDMVYKAYFGLGGTTGGGDNGNGNGGGNGGGHLTGPNTGGGGHLTGPNEGGATQDPNANLIGDTDLNGKVNTADATYLLKAIAYDQVSTFSTDRAKNSDTNFDGTINSADATLILKYCAGLISKF